MRRYDFVIAAVAVLLTTSPALAQADAGHDMHRGHEPSASSPGGAWSYIDRDNPAAPTDDRWTFVPGDGAAFVDGGGLSAAGRCAALARAPHVAVDDETRDRCGLSRLPPAEAAPMPMNRHTGHEH